MHLSLKRDCEQAKKAFVLYILLIMLKKLILYCSLMGHATISSSLSILLVQPTPSTSHHVWTMNLLKGLLSKGHHVHIVSIHEPNIEGKLAENMTYGVSIYMLKEI